MTTVRGGLGRLELVGSHLLHRANHCARQTAPAPAAIVFGAPSRYVQGPNTIERDLASLVAEYTGAPPVLVADELVHSLLCSRDETICSWPWHRFGGECSAEEIARVAESCRAAGGGVVIGAGGGKCIDAAKGAQIELGGDCTLFVVPTVAATGEPSMGAFALVRFSLIVRFALGLPS
eukprot:SAG31_NODE_155_length_22130_cov_9.540098_2_plen_178_part_00